MKMQAPLPWEIALQAQADVLKFAESPEGKRYMNGWVTDRHNKYGKRAASPSAAALGNAVRDLMLSEPLYVTEEMQELVYVAMETFDRREPMSELDFFLKSGFAYLAHPFTTIDMNNLRVSHRAYQWYVEDMTFSKVADDDEYDRYLRQMSGGEEEGMLIESKIEPGLRVILWSHIDDKDDIWNEESNTMLISGFSSKWSVSHATAMPLSEISNSKETTGEADIKAHWLTFLRVMNRLCAEKIITRSRYKASRSLRRHAGRVNLKVEDVIVVELRRRSQPSGSSENGEQREYSHRWMVKGHWRWQYYPTLRSHRQKYIGGHVKGPSDKPLIIKKRVWIWDR